MSIKKMEEMIDVVKGYFGGQKYANGTKAVIVYIPTDARKFLDLKPPLKPRFKVFLDKEMKRVIFELQDFVDG